MRYVVGFAFCEDEVLLIEKIKPEWQKGYLNGVGGKIEYGERERSAMSREFEEEAGIYVSPEKWRRELLIIDEKNDNIIYFYSVYLDRIIFDKTIQKTKEKLFKVKIVDIYKTNVIYNLKWIIPFCLDEKTKNRVVVIFEWRDEC